MGKVILINPFEFPQEKEDDFLKSWDEVADYMRKQNGFISAKLHKALTSEARFRYVNVSEWESENLWKDAVTSDHFKELANKLVKEFPHFPAIYEIVRQ